MRNFKEKLGVFKSDRFSFRKFNKEITYGQTTKID